MPIMTNYILKSELAYNTTLLMNTQLNLKATKIELFNLFNNNVINFNNISGVN